MKNIESDIAIFLQEWTQYAENVQIYCDTKALLTIKNTDILKINSIIEKEYGVSTRYLFSTSYKLRKKLFLLGEEELNVGPFYNWTRFKLKFPNIAEINFLTPFSVTLYWHSIPHLINLYDKKGLREALFIGNDFIENISFKYPQILEILGPPTYLMSEK